LESAYSGGEDHRDPIRIHGQLSGLSKSLIGCDKGKLGERI
jgi:hypothetical protein